MDEVFRCLVYVNVKNSKNTRKGEAKLCGTAFTKNKCKCENYIIIYSKINKKTKI